jgi:hypothetical protein
MHQKKGPLAKLSQPPAMQAALFELLLEQAGCQQQPQTLTHITRLNATGGDTEELSSDSQAAINGSLRLAAGSAPPMPKPRVDELLGSPLLESADRTEQAPESGSPALPKPRAAERSRGLGVGDGNCSGRASDAWGAAGGRGGRGSHISSDAEQSSANTQTACAGTTATYTPTPMVSRAVHRSLSPNRGLHADMQSAPDDAVDCDDAQLVGGLACNIQVC